MLLPPDPKCNPIKKVKDSPVITVITVYISCLLEYSVILCKVLRKLFLKALLKYDYLDSNDIILESVCKLYQERWKHAQMEIRFYIIIITVIKLPRNTQDKGSVNRVIVSSCQVSA
jgi:hypothetical protein